MKVSGEHTFGAPPEKVWKALLDPEILAATMPGCEKLDLVGENQYVGALKIKVGPVQGQFEGKVGLEDLDPPHAFTMQVDGRGAPGFVKATARIVIEAQGEQQTLMRYDGDAQVGGRIASVGQRLLDSSARAIIKQSLEGLGGVLEARSAATAAGAGEAAAAAASAAAARAAAPTQAEFAATVAKEVAKDLIPPAARPVLVVAGILLLLLVLYLLLG